MPVLVIFELDQKPKMATLPDAPFHVGRDESNQIVLPGKGISRKHATFASDLSGHWVVRCVSKTNRIVVDSAVIGGEAELAEGSEVLIGPDHLLIFSESESKARSYMGDKKIYAQSVCGACGWEGVVSAVRKDPICPKCASADLRGKGRYARDEAIEQVVHGGTQYVDRNQMRNSLKRLKTAKRSRLERIDGRDGVDRDLSDETAVHIGSGQGSAFELAGFIIGAGVDIQWDGSDFVATSSLSFPAMKINGLKTTSASLNSGDVIEVGKNRFRFITE